MTVVVLGGHGFLGRHIVDVLAAVGAMVRVAPPIEELDLRFAPPTDVADRLRSLGTTVVVNATGQLTGTLPELLQGNADTARRLVDALERVCPGMRLVHLGSAAEYGTTPSAVPIPEDREEQPQSPYGTAKLAASQVLLEATRRGAVDAVLLRVFNPLGRGQPCSTLPGTVARQLVADRNADITVGPLSAVRDFVSARDIGRAAAAAALVELPAWVRSPRENRLVNVGSGSARPVRDVVETLRARGGHQGRLIERDAGGSQRSGAVIGAPAEVTRAAQLLGWRPEDDLDHAVDEILAGARAELGPVDAAAGR
jgi:nucleoside-diphosphate-sugar epimerase